MPTQLNAENMRKVLLILLLAWPLLPLICSAQGEIVGAWELVYVAPAGLADTSPRGITNEKLYFTANGKFADLLPEEKTGEKTKFSPYQFDGKQLTVSSDNSGKNTVNISFPDSDTMVLKSRYASERRLKRLADPNTILEPQSLQLIKASPAQSEASDHIQYDSADYSSLPFAIRLTGVWEIIAYEHVPQHQLPPYGFFNDIWIFGKDTVTLKQRIQNRTVSGTYSVNDQHVVSIIGDGKAGNFNGKVWFDKWGHLHFDFGDAEMVFKLVTKKTAEPPDMPLKVVLVNTIKDK